MYYVILCRNERGLTHRGHLQVITNLFFPTIFPPLRHFAVHFVLFRAVIAQVKRTLKSLEAARSDCPLGTVSIAAHIAHANP